MNLLICDLVTQNKPSQNDISNIGHSWYVQIRSVQIEPWLYWIFMVVLQRPVLKKMNFLLEVLQLNSIHTQIIPNE